MTQTLGKMMAPAGPLGASPVSRDYGDRGASKLASNLASWIASREASASQSRGLEQAVTTICGEDRVTQTTHNPSPARAELVLISMSDPKAACTMLQSLAEASSNEINSK